MVAVTLGAAGAEDHGRATSTTHVGVKIAAAPCTPAPYRSASSSAVQGGLGRHRLSVADEAERLRQLAVAVASRVTQPVQLERRRSRLGRRQS